MTGAGAQLLSFEVAGRRLALSAADVREVVTRRSLVPVPQAPASLLGLTNLRGTALPVISLAALLDRPEGAARRILVLDGESLVGLAVDTVLGHADSLQRIAILQTVLTAVREEIEAHEVKLGGGAETPLK